MRERVADPPLAKPLRIPQRPVPGVNLVGYLEGESGLGEVARRLGAALQRTDIPFSAISYRRTPSRQQHRVELPLAVEAPYDTNLICLNADSLAQFAADVGIELFGNRYSIGVWFWETNVFRAEDRAAARFLDEIWVASDYVRRAIAPEVDIPVHVVPVPVEPPQGPLLTRSELDLPDGFIFLFLFDFVSTERKNPLGVVEAFTGAFAPAEGPTLVLKSINGRERKPRHLKQLLAATEGRSDVVVRDKYVSAAERDSYVAACDCYVSLHRSEGFGLTLTEAMACGKPVIATGYSGNLEFMDDSNSYLVPYRVTGLPTDWWAYSPGAEWADPDKGATAASMREVYEHRNEASARGQVAQADLVRRFSFDRTASFMVDRLADARARRAARSGLANDARTHVLEASQALASGVGGSLGRSSRRGPSAFIRRALLRALWPYLAEQRSFDSALLDATIALQRSQECLQDETNTLIESRTGDESETSSVSEV
jgi:glycosyltransferase involved in cell wall biosynthesis